MLPADPKAENAVLGAIVLRPACWPELAALCEPADFTGGRVDIARALWALADRGADVDTLTLAREMGEAAKSSARQLEDVWSVVTAFAAPQHAKRVRDVAAMRRLVEAAQDVVERAARPWALQEPTEFVETAGHRLAEASQVREESSAVHVADVVRSTIGDMQARREGKRDGLSVEWPDLNDLLRGFRPGQLIVIAARPGVGKTAIGLDIARHLTRKAHTGLLFSLEMLRDELADRLLAAEANVDTHEIESGRISADRFNSICHAAERLQKFALYIDDSSALPIHQLTARSRAFHARRVLSFVMVDYLQLVRPSRRGHSRESEVAEMSGALKALAKDLRVPVIAMAQFNRDAEEREPRMSDLRESGAIEQDADKIIALHPETLPKGEEARPGAVKYRRTKAIALKNRRGPTGFAWLDFHGRTTTFKEVER